MKIYVEEELSWVTKPDVLKMQNAFLTHGHSMASLWWKIITTKYTKLLEWLNYKKNCELIQKFSVTQHIILKHNDATDPLLWHSFRTRIMSSYMLVSHYIFQMFFLLPMLNVLIFPYHTEYTLHNMLSHILDCLVIMIVNHIAKTGPPWLNIALYAQHEYWVMLLFSLVNIVVNLPTYVVYLLTEKSMLISWIEHMDGYAWIVAVKFFLSIILLIRTNSQRLYLNWLHIFLWI